VQRAYLDKAHYEVERGDFTSAKLSLTRAREYSANPRQAADLTLSLLDLCLLNKDWDGLRMHLVRPDVALEAASSPSAAARVALATGYSQLASGRFGAAADALLALPLAYTQGSLPPPSAASEGVLLDCVHGEDAAPAAILCALASYPLERLSALVSGAGPAKAVLASSPALRDVVLDALAGRHAAALVGAARLGAGLRGEWGVGDRLPSLLLSFRASVLAAYVAPYASLSLPAMAATLSAGGAPCDVNKLEGELAELIGAGRVAARLDGVTKRLRARAEDRREAAGRALAETQRALECEAQALMLRAAMVRLHLAGGGRGKGEPGARERRGRPRLPVAGGGGAPGGGVPNGGAEGVLFPLGDDLSFDEGGSSMDEDGGPGPAPPTSSQARAQ
jgi:hypothetical protein